MSTARFVDVHIGDAVQLRKPHACGSYDWTVVRLGADIGLTCDRCGHRILLARSVFERRLKSIMVHAQQGEADAEASRTDTRDAQ